MEEAIAFWVNAGRKYMHSVGSVAEFKMSGGQVDLAGWMESNGITTVLMAALGTRNLHPEQGRT